MTEDIRPEGSGDLSAAQEKPKEPKMLPAKRTIVVFAVVLIVSILVSVLLTFSLTLNSFFRPENEASYRLRMIAELIAKDAYYDIDEEALIEAALDGYVGALNDDYAVFYTKEEYKAEMESFGGQFVGIGVAISHEEIMLGGKTEKAIRIVSVTEGSSAEEAGLRAGDYIVAIVGESGEMTVSELSYQTAVSMIKGEAGTTVTLSILRRNGNDDVIKHYKVERRPVVFESVTFERCPEDPTVGVIRIKEFNLLTPSQLQDAMDTLVSYGIEKFILDLRDNGGGGLESVVACAGYFLEENDLVLTKERKSGDRTEYRAVPRSGEIKVKKEDIGKYRGYKYVLLVNGNTASAAEIMTAAFRDYALGTVVGTRTFGKGIVQTTYDLGDIGAVKFTTSLYYPPCGVCYHGEGILPDVIEADEKAQLHTALTQFSK